jgi:prevent-host-death family protein
MKKIYVSATQAAQHFGRLICRVRYGGERIVIVKHRRPLCELVPVTGEDCQQPDDVAVAKGTDAPRGEAT